MHECDNRGRADKAIVLCVFNASLGPERIKAGIGEALTKNDAVTKREWEEAPQTMVVWLPAEWFSRVSIVIQQS